MKVERQLKLYRALDRLYRLQDDASRELTAYLHGPVCVEGCGRCCTVPAASFLEAGRIAAELPAFGHQLRRRVLQWIETPIDGLLFGPPINHPALTVDDKRRLLADVQTIARTNCPFLDGMGCAIYSVRPIMCRAYGVTRPADTICKRPISSWELPGRRAIVSADTPLGASITAAIAGIWDNMDHEVGHLHAVGHLPALIAEIIDPRQLLALAGEQKIQPGKLAKLRWHPPNPFLGADGQGGPVAPRRLEEIKELVEVR